MIFLAEDDSDLRVLLTTTLRADGYDVRDVSDGSELLSLLARATLPLERPEVIITDVLMPGYSGLGILAAVRGAGWSTPVILITARRDEALKNEAADLGATAFLQKPFDVDDLRVAIVNALRA